MRFLGTEAAPAPLRRVREAAPGMLTRQAAATSTTSEYKEEIHA